LKEFFKGVDSSQLVNIDRANCHQNRIAKMIQYLQNQNPDENWGQFLTSNGQIRWEMISLAGHSQGSGHAFYISTRVNLLRASFFSGPNGFILANGQYPTWIKSNNGTPLDKMYAFTNTNDNLSKYNLIANTWQNIGLQGTEINVDKSSDFNNSHRLITEIIPDQVTGSASPTHGSTTVDVVTPLDVNNKPVFGKVWKYMCFP
jgi:hypothetical protein